MLRNIFNCFSSSSRHKIKRKLFKYRYYYHKRVSGKYDGDDFESFLRNRLKIKPGDHIMIHSSQESLLYWGLSAGEILNILKDIITPDGIIILPTFVTRHSKEYVKKHSSFNVNRTPSQMGLLSELFRRQKDVKRSLDPLKSFAAWGGLKDNYLNEHHLSEYSYDKKSPLYKLTENNGKIIGLGAPIHNLTLVHTIENVMGDSFPVKIYGQNGYEFSVIDEDGSKIKVTKKIMNNPYSNKMDIKGYCKKHISKGVTNTFFHRFSPYFVCNAGNFLEESIEASKKGITIYGKFQR